MVTRLFGSGRSSEVSQKSNECFAISSRVKFGAIAGALIGIGMDGDEETMEAGAVVGAAAAEDGILGDETMWSVADTIPMDSTAAVALIEHRWAIPLRDAIRSQGGVPLADSWIHPEDLVAIGAAASAN